MDECKPLERGGFLSLKENVCTPKERLDYRGGAVQVVSMKTRVESAPGFSA